MVTPDRSSTRSAARDPGSSPIGRFTHFAMVGLCEQMPRADRSPEFG